MVRSGIVALLLVSSCRADSAFVKKVETKKSSKQLKQETAEELEALLTQTIDMIASLGELQKQLICKIQEIVFAPSDSFFAQAKPSGLQQYHAQIVRLKTEVEARYASQHQWINDITHNFQKG